MPKRPRKKKPPNPNYEHITLRGSGFWMLPDLTTCEGVERGRWTNQLVIRGSTFDGRRMAIPFLIPAVQSFVAADPIAVPFQTPTHGKGISPPNPGKTMETPLLSDFVCFRAVNEAWWILEFLTEKKDQHVLVSFSFAAYKQLITYLKTISTTP